MIKAHFSHLISMILRTAAILVLVLNSFSGSIRPAAALPGSAPALQTIDCATVTEIPQTECDALVALYSSTSGANWTNNAGWLQTDTPCSWYGIFCVGGHVNSITFDNNNLTGSIPPEMGGLSELQTFRVWHDNLTGALPPELGDLSNLKFFWLDDNQISGAIPDALGDLTNLRVLALDQNHFSGSIPASLGSLVNLQYLNLATNDLTGSIPSTFGNLTSLNELWLFETQISGSIPPELGFLTSLTQLGLHNNALTGSLPSEIGNLINLQHLSVANNQLSGEIPASITDLTSLTHLTLSCGLTSANPVVIAFLNQKAPGWRCSNARFHVQMVQNDVEGYGWPVNDSITLTIDDPTNGVGVDFTDTRTSDPNGTVRFSDLGSIDLAPGMYVTMSDNTTFKDHTVTNLMVTGVDVNEDTVSGTGTPGARINVQYCHAAPGCAWRRWATVQPDHSWNVDFSVAGSGTDEQQILNILSTTYGEAIEPDADADHTDYAWFDPPPLEPQIGAGLTLNTVDAYNWPVGTLLTLSIEDPHTELSPDYRTTAILQSDDPFAAALFQFGDSYTLHPGDEVTVTGGDTTRTTTVADIHVTDVDVENDIVSGTAGEGITNVNVALWTARMQMQRDAAVLNGVWSADFSIASPEYGIYDIKPGDSGVVRWNEGDSDFTTDYWHVYDPSITAHFDNWIAGLDWPLGSTVHVEVDDPANGTGVDFSSSKSGVGPDPDNPTVTWIQFDLGAFQIAPGQTITMWDSPYTTTRTMVVADLRITAVDLNNDVISGTTNSTSPIEVHAWCGDISALRLVTPVNGAWSADFSEVGSGPSPEEQVIQDLDYNCSGPIHQDEADGDYTTRHWRPTRPAGVVANLSRNQIYSETVPLGSQVTITVDDPSNGPGLDYTDSGIVGETGGNDPTYTWVEFNLANFVLKPNDIVVMSGNSITKQLIVQPLEITDVDAEADLVHGTTEHGLKLSVFARGTSGEWGTRNVTADSNGNWVADFRTAGNEPDEQVIIDITPITDIDVDLFDIDGDYTEVVRHVPHPNIGANVKDNNIAGDEWLLGRPVTLTVDHPANGAGIDFQQQQTPQPAPWDSNQTYVQFDLGNFQVQPNDHVEMSNGLITKSLVVQYLEVTGINLDTNTVSGLADPGVEVFAQVEGPDGWALRRVTSAQNGAWSADFSTPGTGSDEQQVVDITYGMNTNAHRQDEDGDYTEFGFAADWVAPASIPLVFAISSPVDLRVPRGTLENISVLNTLNDSLFQLDQEGNLQPLAATGYSVSANGLVYTVNLRSGALWSDGQPVTAQQYVDGILRILDSNVGSDYGFLFFPILNAKAFHDGSITNRNLVGIKALNNLTLEFTLERPTAHFPQILVGPVTLPARQDVIDQYGEAWTSPQHFVGNGPYKLVEYDAGHILVEKNPAYNGPVQGVFSQIGFDVIPNPADQVTAYKNGDVDVLLNIPLGTITGDPILKADMAILPSPGVQYIGFTTQVAPTNNPLVRAALASAVDRQILVDDTLMTPWRVEATGVIPPELAGYQGSAVGYSYDPVQARAFLAQAGYPGGVGFPALNLVATPNNTAIMEDVRHQWETVLGITVNIDYVTYDERYSILGNCRSVPATCAYNGYLWGWVVDYSDAYNILHDLFSPDSPYNYTQWDNSDYRVFMDLAVSEVDPAQRINYLQQAEQILVQQDTAVMPLFHTDSALVVRPGVYPYYSPTYFSNLAYWSDHDPAGDGMTAEVIGSSGGTISTASNTVSADVPVDALQEDVTLSVTDLGGNYQITTSQEKLDVLSSFNIQPHGLQFAVPVTLTFAWNDADNDGLVDGTTQAEGSIFLVKDGQQITPACDANPGCDMLANLLSVDVSTLSRFELVIPTAPPAAFDKSGPANGTIDLPTSVTLSWSISSDATEYEYCYDETNDNACSVWVSNGTSTSKSLSGLKNQTTYYWHIRAVSVGGTTYSDNSSTAFSSFATIPGAATDLSRPILLSPPGNNHTTHISTPTFTWHGVTNAHQYEIQLSTDSAFPQSANSYFVPDLTFTLSTSLPDGKYYWRVRAYNAANQYGEWSAVRSFRVDTVPPAAPLLRFPINNASVRLAPTFRWFSVGSAVAYQFEIDNDSNFSSPTFGVIQRTPARRPPGVLHGTYYWRVRAQDAAGNWSDWSQVFLVNILPFR
ncbi:MAG TPA: ABC transporter substrate-binding protein [Anaerolineales bacterium]|nr:ABC transporter substrate-binding protein [Anaerolineales bacterium]